MELSRRILQGLGRPVHRIGFLIFTLGLALVLGGLAAWALEYGDSYYHRRRFMEFLFRLDHGDAWNKVILLGLSMSILGGSMAWMYEHTIGPIITGIKSIFKWVMNGSSGN